MGREIEIKLKMDDTAPTLAKLRALGAAEIDNVVETNLFFDQSDSRLMEAKSALRVRLFTRGGKKDTRGLATYKADPKSGPMHNRQSFDVNVDPVDEFIEMLKALRYAQWLGFEKRRHSFHLDDCRVELDELPAALGRYVEIEGPSEASVLAARERLGLSAIKNHESTYLKMIRDYCARNPEAGAMARF